MATCSQPYLDLVRTTSGLTPKAPWRGLSLFGQSSNGGPSPFEYDEWRDLAGKLAREAFTHLEALGKAPLGTAKWDELRPLAIELWNEANGLPEALTVAEGAATAPGVVEAYRTYAEEAKTIAVDSACLMETIDNALLVLGVQPPSISTKPLSTGGSILGTALTVLLLGGVVGGTIWAIKSSRSPKGEEAKAA